MTKDRGEERKELRIFVFHTICEKCVTGTDGMFTYSGCDAATEIIINELERRAASQSLQYNKQVYSTLPLKCAACRLHNCMFCNGESNFIHHKRIAVRRLTRSVRVKPRAPPQVVHVGR